MKAVDVYIIIIIRPSKKIKVLCRSKNEDVALQSIKFTNQNCFTFIFSTLILAKSWDAINF